MSIKSEINQIIGKTIMGIVTVKNNRPPFTQVFIVFGDETFIELFANDDISSTHGVSQGGLQSAIAYANRLQGDVTVIVTGD